MKSKAQIGAFRHLFAYRCSKVFGGLFFLLILCCAIFGCSAVRNFPHRQAKYEDITAGYEQIRLKADSSLEVLKIFRELELQQQAASKGSYFTSQRDTVVALAGQAKKGYKTWLTMVAFDGQTLTAARKYFYLVDERVSVPLTQPIRLLLEPKQGLGFDCQVQLSSETLNNPYASTQSRQIEIVRQIARNFRRDVNNLAEYTNKTSESNQSLIIPGMLMNQVFEAVLLELDKSPVLAMRLVRRTGVEFNHITFDKGRIRMVVDNDIATVKIRLGLFRYELEQAGQ